MRRERELKEKAKKATRRRMHKMSQWHEIQDNLWWSACKICGMSVRVNLHSASNKIDGQAVARRCTFTSPESVGVVAHHRKVPVDLTPFPDSVSGTTGWKGSILGTLCVVRRVGDDWITYAVSEDKTTGLMIGSGHTHDEAAQCADVNLRQTEIH